MSFLTHVVWCLLSTAGILGAVPANKVVNHNGLNDLLKFKPRNRSCGRGLHQLQNYLLSPPAVHLNDFDVMRSLDDTMPCSEVRRNPGSLDRFDIFLDDVKNKKLNAQRRFKLARRARKKKSRRKLAHRHKHKHRKSKSNRSVPDSSVRGDKEEIQDEGKNTEPKYLKDIRNDPLNKWMEKDPENKELRKLLTKVMTKKRRLEGDLREIHTVSTNHMDDMTLFKMTFSILPPGEKETKKCRTVFSQIKGKVFLGKMECPHKPPKTVNGEWIKQEPEDQRFMLPLMLAMKMSWRKNANPNKILDISTKRSDKKIEFDVKFTVENRKKVSDTECHTKFNMYDEEYLRPIEVKSFVCDDNKNSGRNKRPKPNIKKLGIAKVFAFYGPKRETFLIPTTKNVEKS